ncbi:hypothetical protein B0T21DRAFT_370462, partial [Apiosordaria backusii]
MTRHLPPAGSALSFQKSPEHILSSRRASDPSHLFFFFLCTYINLTQLPPLYPQSINVDTGKFKKMNNFGVIEVAGTANKATPGWAYVPDTGPALPAALQPKNRKRAAAARNQPGLSLSDLTARQENKLRKDLEALNKDNHRDVNIPVPHKTGGGSRSQNKHTPNVRKILQSQKTFANHLDDYQALLALAESNPAAVVNHPLLFLNNKPLTTSASATPAKSASPAPAPPPPTTTAEKGGASKRSAAAAKRAAAKEKEEERKKARLAAAAKLPEPAPPPPPPLSEETPQEEDVEMVDISDPPPQQQQEEKELPTYPPDGTILPPYKKQPPVPHPGDNDPLLVYLEARATFGGEEGTKYPTRVFCEMCGYWGRVKCIKCGVRVCALDCLEAHREECVTRYGL